MKKFLSIIGSAFLMLSLVACGAQPTNNSDKLSVVTTSYALKYFIEQVGGDEVEVVFSLTSNPHHFELSQTDAQKIAKADIFFNVEAGDYIAIGEKIKNVNKDMQTINVAEGTSLIPYVGHDHDHEEDHEHVEEETEHADEHTHSHDEDEHEVSGPEAFTEEYDPHIWLDPIKAKTIVANIKEALFKVDGINKENIGKNAGTLQEKLGKLDEKMNEELENLTTPYIVVSHAAYGYLAHHYHFEQKSVNSGTDHSENTQSSMIEMDEFIAEHQIKYLFVETNIEANSSIDVLVKKHNLETLPLFNLETPVDESQDYFKLMEKNLENIKKATK